MRRDCSAFICRTVSWPFLFRRIPAVTGILRDSETLPTPSQLGHTKLTRCTLLFCALASMAYRISTFQNAARSVAARRTLLGSQHHLGRMRSTSSAAPAAFNTLRDRPPVRMCPKPACLLGSTPCGGCLCVDPSACLPLVLQRCKVLVELALAGARLRARQHTQQSPSTRQCRPPGANVVVEQRAKPRVCSWICFPFAVCRVK